MTKLELDTRLNELAAGVADRAKVPDEFRDAVVDAAYDALHGLAYGEPLRVHSNTRRTNLTTCAFCPATSNDPCGADWLPFYWDKELDLDVDGPVCPDCIKSRLTYDPESEEYFLPPTTNFDLKFELPSDG